MRGFVRVKDCDGTEHMIKPQMVTRLSEVPRVDPPPDIYQPSVYIHLSDLQIIRVVGTLDGVAKVLELYA